MTHTTHSAHTIITKRELIQSDIEVHGHAFAAKRQAKKIPFTIFHFLAFGYLPRCTIKPLVLVLEGQTYSFNSVEIQPRDRS